METAAEAIKERREREFFMVSPPENLSHQHFTEFSLRTVTAVDGAELDIGANDVQVQ
jgi:hypothetical protein